jgi:hypothetical protein
VSMKCLYARNVALKQRNCGRFLRGWRALGHQCFFFFKPATPLCRSFFWDSFVQTLTNGGRHFTTHGWHLLRAYHKLLENLQHVTTQDFTSMQTAPFFILWRLHFRTLVRATHERATTLPRRPRRRAPAHAAQPLCCCCGIAADALSTGRVAARLDGGGAGQARQARCAPKGPAEGTRKGFGIHGQGVRRPGCCCGDELEVGNDYDRARTQVRPGGRQVGGTEVEGADGRIRKAGFHFLDKINLSFSNSLSLPLSLPFPFPLPSSPFLLLLFPCSLSPSISISPPRFWRICAPFS